MLGQSPRLGIKTQWLVARILLGEVLLTPHKDIERTSIIKDTTSTIIGSITTGRVVCNGNCIDRHSSCSIPKASTFRSSNITIYCTSSYG